MNVTNYSAYVASIWKPLPDKNDRLVHAALGIAGESGEVVDLIKKSVIYERTLDTDKIKEELGDVMYYIAALCNELGLQIEDITCANYDKLSKRYATGKFSTEQAINRADKQGA